MKMIGWDGNDGAPAKIKTHPKPEANAKPKPPVKPKPKPANGGHSILNLDD